MVITSSLHCPGSFRIFLISEVSLTPGAQIRASLFVTCIVDQLYPQVGVSVVRVLRRLGVAVDFPPDQTCCGQPMYNSGFTAQARQLARRTLTSLKNSDYVVVPSGSCAAMLRVFYQDLFAGDPEAEIAAAQLAERVYEFSEFLVKVVGVTDLGVAYPASATYHPSCHLLREMEVRQEPMELLERVSGLEISPLPQAEACCGFGGAFSVKYPHISESMMNDKIANIQATEADTLIACDMGCLMHLGGGLSRRNCPVKATHIAQILDGKASEGPHG